jgi:hypothetical protein
MRLDRRAGRFPFITFLALLLLVAFQSGCVGVTSQQVSGEPSPVAEAQAPAVTSQPASQTVTAGQGATFSVVASGTAPLSYQWRRNGVPLSGATSASYTTPSTTTSDNGAQFTVVVSNSTGSVTSDAATLTVTSPSPTPSITTASLPAGTVGSPYSAALSASAGTPPYTWSVSAGPLPNGLSLNSPAGLIAGTPGMAGQFTFTVQVRDSAGATAAATFTLTIATSSPGPPGQTVPNLKIAFLGDQGNGSNASAVLQLIKNEGAHAVIHSGDFDYADNPTAWDNLITSVLGASYPYFGSVGNHDVSAWPGYQQKLAARLALVPDATCVGDLGVKSACYFRGLFFLLDGAGTMGSGHDLYLRDQLAADNSVWSVCSWHKNQRAMQIGGKSDEVGWEPYEECRKGGAVIATAHEHSYSRTRTLINIPSQTVDASWPDALELRVTPGSTFVFVSGLGGNSIRDQERCLPATFPYGCNGEWASIYSSNQSAKYGALFIVFHVDGDPRKARGYFKNVAGEVVDEFVIFSQ